MKPVIKRVLESYPFLLLRELISKEAICDFLHIRRKPHTIQLPITSRCNSRCETCNVWKLKDNVDIDAKRLSEVLKDPYLYNIENIGVNGGELTLVKNFYEILDSLFQAPNLKNLHLISNGLLPNKLLPILQKTKEICTKKGVKLHFMLSVDGVGDVHEGVRGVPNCFERTKFILDTLKENPSMYADSIMIGCTLSQANIPYVIQTETYLNQYPFKIQFHLAVANKRIHTFEDSDRYNILSDKYSTMLATEFFHKKFMESKWPEKYSYFSQYYFLKRGGGIRLARCPYKYKDITIDEHLNLYLCATASDVIGSLYDSPIKSLMRRNKLSSIEQDINNNCSNCAHYIYEKPTWKGYFLFILELFHQRFDWGRKFQLLAK